MDSLLPWLFLKVEVTRILAIGFLDDQNCREKKTVNDIYTNMRFMLYTKYVIIL